QLNGGGRHSFYAGRPTKYRSPLAPDRLWRRSPTCRGRCLSRHVQEPDLRKSVGSRMLGPRSLQAPVRRSLIPELRRDEEQAGDRPIRERVEEHRAAPRVRDLESRASNADEEGCRTTSRLRASWRHRCCVSSSSSAPPSVPLAAHKQAIARVGTDEPAVA